MRSQCSASEIRRSRKWQCRPETTRNMATGTFSRAAVIQMCRKSIVFGQCALRTRYLRAVVKASLHTQTRDSKLLFGRYIEGAAPSGSPRDWLTCSQLLEHHTHIPYHVDKPYSIDTKYRHWVHSLHCMHITTIEATCSGRQADDILFSPAETRSERTRPSCDKGRTGLANTVGKWEAKVRL